MKDLWRGWVSTLRSNLEDSKYKYSTLSQASYIRQMFARYVMQNSVRGLLTLIHGVHLSEEQFPQTPQEMVVMRRSPYSWNMGSHMYALFYTGSDICYAKRHG